MGPEPMRPHPFILSILLLCHGCSDAAAGATRDAATDEPELAQLERSYLAAKKVEDELREISPVQGLHVADYKKVRTLIADVQELRRQWAIETGDPGDLVAAIEFLGRKEGQSSQFIEWAVVLRGAIPDDFRKAEYDQFLIEHEDVLRMFFPELYGSQRVSKLLFEAGVR